MDRDIKRFSFGVQSNLNIVNKFRNWALLSLLIIPHSLHITEIHKNKIHSFKAF